MSVNITITDSSNPDDIGTTWTTDEDGTHHTVNDLTFDRVSDKNNQRCLRWHEDSEAWTGADWATAMGGECGEALNVVKKIRRVECGMAPGPSDPPMPELMTMLADELADTFLYLDLLANFYKIDLPKAIVGKFNRVSERQGFPERLP